MGACEVDKTRDGAVGIQLRIRSVDIDTHLDWVIAETLMKQNQTGKQ